MSEVKTSRRTCRAEQQRNGVRWACTRPEGHAGKHEAQGVNGLVLHRWAKVAR